MTDVETRHPGLRGGLAAAVLACFSATALGAAPEGPQGAPADASRPAPTLDAYLALSASQSRNYDRKQDISPRQMLLS